MIERIKELVEQEPVAWVAGYKTGQSVITPIVGATVFPTGLALYTAPPRREWVGLTDDERESILLEAFSKYDDGDLDFVACATEAKLKEKNHG